MNNEEIIEILAGWNFWKKDIDTGIFRENYISKAERFLRTGQVVALTGVRRCGKSTLMKQFIKKQIAGGKSRASFLYVNFEEPKFAGMLSLKFLQQIYESFLEIIKPAGKPFLLLDEVHNVPQWERFVRGLHEKTEAQIIISGSTSKLLSKELGTLLSGRWCEVKVFPLSFGEFLYFHKVETGGKLDILSNKTKIKQLLRDYMEFGGFPLAVLSSEKQEILTRYFEDIIARDVAERHKVRQVEKLKSLARYYLTNFTKPVSYRGIAKFIGLSLDTVERFSAYFAEANLIFFIPKFSFSLKEQEINFRHVYGIDSGLINIVSFRFSENIGRLYENAVLLKLIGAGKQVYYYKNKNECDFVIMAGKKISQAIQVTYFENNEREVNGLLEAMKEFKLNRGIIITEDKEDERTVGGKSIKYIPLWKWLLEQ